MAFVFACLSVVSMCCYDKMNPPFVNDALSSDRLMQSFRQTSDKDKALSREDTEETAAKKPRLETDDEKG